MFRSIGLVWAMALCVVAGTTLSLWAGSGPAGGVDSGGIGSASAVRLPDDCNSNGIPDEEEIGPPIEHNCCETGHGAGCSDPEIQACVCAVDPYCCNGEWDSDCAALVEALGCGFCTVENDCNGNGILDECDIDDGFSLDCNLNGVPDECDLAQGTSADCNMNGVPDECDIDFGTSEDCDGNGVPDECQVSANTGIRIAQESASGAGDFDDNILGTVTAYQTTLDAAGFYRYSLGNQSSFNGPEPTLTAERSHIFLVDATDGLSLFVVHDKPGNSGGGNVSTRYEVFGDPDGLFRSVEDDPNEGYTGNPGDSVFTCNHNWATCCTDGVALSGLSGNWSLIMAFTSNISGMNSCAFYVPGADPIPLALERDRRIRIDVVFDPSPDDCNGNGRVDVCDVLEGLSEDCNTNLIPDECEVPPLGEGPDCNEDGIPDECQLLDNDCNLNEVPDDCDIAGGLSDDCNANGIPDECEPDCNTNGIADECDISGGTSTDYNGNGIPDECEPDAPDLIVTAITGPTLAVPGEAITVSWTVLNDGVVLAPASWVDSVYLSADQTWEPGTDLLLGSLTRDEDLASGESYDASLDVQTPAELGAYWLIVVTDVNDDVEEVAGEVNNTLVDDEELAVVEAGSRVLSVNISGSYNNDGYNLYQTLVNAGANAEYVLLSSNGMVASRMARTTYDQIWVFDLSTGGDNYTADYQAIADWFNAGDEREIICDSRIISSYWNGRWTGEGQNLTENYYVNMRGNPAGGLMLGTDHNAFQGGINTINELIGIEPFCCNFSLQFIPVDVDNPLMNTPNDLGPQLYDDSSPGQTPYGLQANGRILYTVAWHSGNRDTPGISSTIEGAIGFQVTIIEPEDGALFDVNVPITFTAEPANGDPPYTYAWSSDVDGAIGEGESIEVSTLSPGVHTIMVLAEDGFSRDDDDSISITILETPDLTVTMLTGPEEANYAEPIDVLWTVLNQGDLVADGSWVDRVYLSTDEELDGGDALLGQLPVTGPLAIDATYDGALSAGVNVAPGTYWLIVKTDAGEAVDEGLHEDNNVLVSSVPLQVRTPNLTVESVEAPEIAFDGEEAELTWTVRNVGDGAARSPWMDRVYLSLDGELNEEQDVLLGSFSRDSDLAADGSYSRTEDVVIPLGLNGDYYFIVVTDVLDAVPEYDGEDDNQRVSDPATTILQPDLPDFEVTEFIASSARYIGQPFVLGWRVENTGPGTANGSWIDRAYLSADDVFDPGGDVLLEQVTLTRVLSPGGIYVQTTEFDLPDVAGPYWLFVQLDALETIREEDDANNLAVYPIEVLAPEYTATVEADVESAPVGTPVTLSGQATDIDSGEPAGEVDVDIRLNVRGTQRSFRVQTLPDGTFSRVFSPLPEEAGVYTISADHPAVEDEPAEDTFTIYGMRVQPSAASLTLTVGDVFNGSFTVRNLGDAPLTAIVSEVVDLPASLALEVSGPEALGALESATVSYTLTALDTADPVSHPEIRFVSAEGAEAGFAIQVQIRPPAPALVADPVSLQANMLRGERTFVAFDVINIGGAPTSLLFVQIPPTDWLGLASPATIPALDPAESATITLQLDPAIDLPLGPYNGSLVVSGNNTSVTVPFEFVAISDAEGDLQIEVTDEFTYYAEGNPRVADATVRVKDANTGEVVAEAITDETGIVLFEDLTEAYYRVEVGAPDHGDFATTTLVPAGDVREIEAFLPREVVSYEWIVVPIEIEDEYEIIIEAEFETDVPMPVVTIEPNLVDLTEMDGPVMQVDFVITNHGLVQADAAQFVYSQHPRYTITPLIEDIGDLPAQTSIEVPVIIEDTQYALDGGDRDNCVGIDFQLQYELFCGVPITYLRPVFFALPEEDCPGVPGGNGGVIIIPPGGGDGGDGDGGPIIINPPQYTEDLPCDPCDVQCVLSLLDCAISFTPAGCVWGLARSCGGFLGDPNAIDCGIGVVGCVVELHPAVNAILCVKGIATGCACEFEGDERGLPDDLFAPIEIESDDPLVAYFIERGNRLIVFTDWLAYPFGDPIWLDVADTAEGAVLSSWLAEFQIAVDEASEEGNLVSADERAALLGFSLPSQLTVADAELFLDRWNRTVDYWSQGIYNLGDVPPGESTDFIERDVWEAKYDAAIAAADADENEGFDSFMASVNYAYEVLREDRTQQSEGLCARVRIQISQQAVVSRSAFQATLILENNGSEYPLEEVLVDVVVRDEDGVPVNELFGFLGPEVTGGLTAFDGTQTLGTLDAATGEWIIVPSDDAAPMEPTLYYVSGMISYIVGDELVEIPLYPVQITVYPNPSLHLKYFLEKVVYSDDPFTPEIIEPAIPFSLGLLVANEGAGEARNLRITSAQPEIIENEQGLLIDFVIIGTQVGLEQISPSLTVNFGTIEPGMIKTARWLLTSTLQGEFVSYSATFENVGPLGELGLSLIDSLEIFEMIHVVRVDWPEDDLLPDYLTNETPDIEDLPDRVHSTDGGVYDVTPITDATVDGPIVPGDFEAELSADLPAGWVYIRAENPGQRKHRLLGVERSDGRVILVGPNAWTTYRVLRPEGEPPQPENLVHVFDYVDSADSYTYTLLYQLVPGDMNCDGVVNAFDIDPFVLAIVNPGAYAVQYPDCDINNADVNHDGAVNNFDIDPFVEVLVGG